MSKFAYFKRKIAVATLILALPVSLFYVDESQVQAEEKKVVRVGYYENDNFQAGAGDDLIKTGYSYEYMRRLQTYTDWEYEYVYGEYGDLYDDLVSGEIDILTGLAYKEDREGIIGYPEKAMGDTPYSFLKRTGDGDITDNPSSISGKKIGVVDGAMKSITETYLNEKHVDAEMVLFDDLKKRDKALVDGDVDITIVEGNGTGAMEGVEAFATAGAADYYVCTNIQRPDILEDLNEAQTNMFQSNPNLKTDLYNTWFRNNAVSATLSKDEKDWVELHKTFTVAYFNDFLPYSDTNAEGEVTGVIKDIVPEMFSLLGIKTVEIKYRGYDTYEEMAKAIKAGEIDACFPSLSNYWTNEGIGLMPTESVYASYCNLIYKDSYPDMKDARIAITGKNEFLNEYCKIAFPEATIVKYDNCEASMDAVVSGEADGCVMNGLRTEYFMRFKNSYKILQSAQISTMAPMGFAVLNSDHCTLDVLNHGIALMDPDFTLSNSYQYEMKHEQTFIEFMQNNMWFPLLVLSLFVTLISVSLGIQHRKDKKYLEDLKREQTEKEKAKEREEQSNYKAEHDDLTGVLNRTAYSRLAVEYSTNKHRMALMIMDVDHFKDVNDTYGHDVGDMLLKNVAETLQMSFRDSDFVIRYGGDEFVVFFNNLHDGFTDHIIKKMQSINNLLQNPGIPGLPGVTVSAGVTEFSCEYDEKIFKQADTALYFTKSHGRAGCTIYSEDLEEMNIVE